MNLNTANLKVGLAASTDATRPNINSIHITPEYTEATNGQIVARVSLPEQYVVGDVPETIVTASSMQLVPVTVSAKAAMSIKLFKHRSFPLLDDTLYVDVEHTNSSNDAKFTATNLEQTITPVFTKVDVIFPDIGRVIPQGRPDTTIKLNISYLQTLLTIAKATGAEKVTLKIFNVRQGVSNTPVVITAEQEGIQQTMLGVIAPLRMEPVKREKIVMEER